jgi:alpha-mannosidase
MPLPWRRALVLGAVMSLLCESISTGAESAPAGGASHTDGTFWLIPHTHWEGAVFKTREEYLEMGLPNILTALRLLKEHPNYRFTLDQVAYFKPFLERYPEEAAAFRQFVADGRLQIVCGLNVMPDDNMPGGESFVRQMLYAKGYCRDALGAEVKVGWLLDTFGHHAQMPQLLKLAGFDSFWFFRGVEQRQTMPSEFLWQGLDGTRLPAFWLPFAYGHLYGPPKDLPRFTDFMKKRYDALTPFSRGPDRVGLAGVDVSEPELHVAALVEQFNRQTNMPFTLRIGVPTDFEKSVAARADLPVITGERNPLFQGIYSSRIELKQRMREMERLLTSAEKFGAVAKWLGLVPDDAMTWRAWEPVLFNVTHDLASGVMTDAVYEDTVRGYEFSKRLAGEMIDTRLGRLLSRIDTRGEGVPVVVFNTLGWPRTDLAEADVGFATSGIAGFSLTDAEGRILPAQLLEAERYRDGGLKRVKVAFVAREVPGLGHCVYHLLPRPAPANASSNLAAMAASNVLENEFYTLRFDLGTGALTNLLVKAGGWEALAGPGNVVAREPDNGDFWELYKNLDGFQNVIMTRPLGTPEAGQAQFSTDPATNRSPPSVRHGSVFSEFRVDRSFGRGRFATTVRLYAGIPRIDFETTLLNNDKFVRYRLLFPTTIRHGRNVHEIPFGAIERPAAQEFPAQNWIDHGDGQRGVALLNRGLPGNNVADGTLMLSLLRSTRIQSYGVGGGFENQSSDSGLELGKELTFHYGLVPHAGDWSAAGVFRRGLEFNQPLITRKAEPHAGALPKRWGLLEVSHPNVVVSALKPGRAGSTILRIYEAGGKATSDAAIKLSAQVISIREANLMEDAGAKLKVAKDTFRFSLHPFEIKTFELNLRPAPK